MTNSIGDFIKSVFPSMVNKSDKVFKSLFTNDEGTGTIESIFSDVDTERKKWCKNSSVYEQVGEQLAKTLAKISLLERLEDESDEAFIKRNKLLFYRNGNEVWGDKWNVLNTFKTFFNNQNVYLANNADVFANSLLLDGNFEKGDAWTLEDCTYEREARFEESTGVLFNASGTCSQVVALENNKPYFLHFFVKGKIEVEVKSNGKYWNPSIGEVGGWSDSYKSMFFESEDWGNKDLFFILDKTMAAANITFKYHAGHYAFLDYVRLFEKDKTSMFSLIAVFEGVYSDETMNLAPGADDPITSQLYQEMGYFSEGSIDAKELNSDDILPLDGYDGMTYLDERHALAPESPVGYDGYSSVDYEKVSYLDNTFIFGATGTAAEKVYKELLDIIQPAGVSSCIEILTREQDE